MTQTPPAEPQKKLEPPALAQDRWAGVATLPCTLTADLSIPHMTIADLLALEVGGVIDSRCPEGSPVPVWVNAVLVAWAEFEVMGNHLGLRITEVR